MKSNSHSANRSKGNFIENHATAYLMREGYQVLARNYAYRGGELDIVAKDNDTIVFVEVKSVWSNGQGNPATRVNAVKQKKVWKTACHFLCTQIKNLDQKSRFDVLSIRAYEHPLRFSHFKNAFEGTQVIPEC
ncbi:YraN family protein [Fibrobacter sp.]|uniref:YraN family protein n=1 Tax=Fibrobacter sp. TaxID=35828 RepID=UPI00388EF492